VTLKRKTEQVFKVQETYPLHDPCNAEI